MGPSTHILESGVLYPGYYRSIFLDFSGPEYVEEPLSRFLTYAEVPPHSRRLAPHHILVEGYEITGILD
jgi:hypothetical protein